MASERDLLAELTLYNRRFTGAGRSPDALARKVERLCDTPFGFFRGTFHLFVRDWPSLAHALQIEVEPHHIVGDLHIENFGAYRASDGQTVFDVNDFDETDNGPLTLDLARMATSIVLADEAQSDVHAVERVGLFLAAWRASFDAGDLRPLGADCDDTYVKHLIAESEAASRDRWLDKRVETHAGGARQFKESDKYRRIADEPLRSAIFAGVRAYGATARDRPDVADWPVVLDVAERIAGTGSLGRHRWAVLIESRKEKRGKERVLELKEALPSALAQERHDDPAEHVIEGQRVLQGASPAYLGVAHVNGFACTVRELQPTEAKVNSAIAIRKRLRRPSTSPNLP